MSASRLILGREVYYSFFLRARLASEGPLPCRRMTSIRSTIPLESSTSNSSLESLSIWTVTAVYGFFFQAINNQSVIEPFLFRDQAAHSPRIPARTEKLASGGKRRREITRNPTHRIARYLPSTHITHSFGTRKRKVGSRGEAKSMHH